MTTFKVMIVKTKFNCKIRLTTANFETCVIEILKLVTKSRKKMTQYFKKEPKQNIFKIVSIWRNNASKSQNKTLSNSWRYLWRNDFICFKISCILPASVIFCQIVQLILIFLWLKIYCFPKHNVTNIVFLLLLIFLSTH